MFEMPRLRVNVETDEFVPMRSINLMAKSRS